MRTFPLLLLSAPGASVPLPMSSQLALCRHRASELLVSSIQPWCALSCLIWRVFTAYTLSQLLLLLLCVPEDEADKQYTITMTKWNEPSESYTVQEQRITR